MLWKGDWDSPSLFMVSVFWWALAKKKKNSNSGSLFSSVIFNTNRIVNFPHELLNTRQKTDDFLPSRYTDYGVTLQLEASSSHGKSNPFYRTLCRRINIAWGKNGETSAIYVRWVASQCLSSLRSFMQGILWTELVRLFWEPREIYIDSFDAKIEFLVLEQE